MLAWLREVYDTYPKRVALLEILVIFGIFVAHRWIVTFWFWGVYRLDLPFPDILSNLFYRIWLEQEIIRTILICILLVFILVSNVVIRRYTFQQVGMRFDNFWTSGRECIVLTGVILCVAAAIVVAFPQSFSFERYFNSHGFTDDIFSALLSGVFQQFILQGVFLVRALQIFKRQSAAVLTSSILFSLLHAPNTKLMLLTLIFGAVCSALFIRHRNIFTLGVAHGVTQQTVRVLFASFLIPYGNVGRYDYNLKVGPRGGDPRFIAILDYNGGSLKANPSGVIAVPIRVINNSDTKWDSDDRDLPAFIGYHLLDAKGDMVSYDNSLTSFSKTIEPGEAATIDLIVSAPATKGDYFVEVDILKREIAGTKITTWFDYRGSKTLRIPLATR